MCIKAHTEFTSTHVPGLLRGCQLQWCHSCWRDTVKEQRKNFWWQQCSTATGTALCKLLHNASEGPRCTTVLCQFGAELKQFFGLICWLFPLPGHQYLICFPSLGWISDPEVPICYQRVVLHMQERADLEMKASSDDAQVTWRWAFQENPCMGTISRFTQQSAWQWPAGLVLRQSSTYI